MVDIIRHHIPGCKDRPCVLASAIIERRRNTQHGSFQSDRGYQEF
jgi:hypothetical protein